MSFFEHDPETSRDHKNWSPSGSLFEKVHVTYGPTFAGNDVRHPLPSYVQQGLEAMTGAALTPVAVALRLAVPLAPVAVTVHVKSARAFTRQVPDVPVDPAQHPDQARLV